MPFTVYLALCAAAGAKSRGVVLVVLGVLVLGFIMVIERHLDYVAEQEFRAQFPVQEEKQQAAAPQTTKHRQHRATRRALAGKE